MGQLGMNICLELSTAVYSCVPPVVTPFDVQGSCVMSLLWNSPVKCTGLFHKSDMTHDHMSRHMWMDTCLGVRATNRGPISRRIVKSLMCTTFTQK